jgi:hypothetical protein
LELVFPGDWGEFGLLDGDDVGQGRDLSDYCGNEGVDLVWGALGDDENGFVVIAAPPGDGEAGSRPGDVRPKADALDNPSQGVAPPGGGGGGGFSADGARAGLELGLGFGFKAFGTDGGILVRGRGPAGFPVGAGQVCRWAAASGWQSPALIADTPDSPGT